MKKKLLIVVGAGASLDFGLPSVYEVDKILDAYAAQWFPLARSPSDNLYRYISSAIRRDKSGSVPNFEEVLYQIYLLYDIYRHGSLDNVESLIVPAPLPDVVEFEFEKPVDANVINTLSSKLIDALFDYFVEKCDLVKSQKTLEFALASDFIKELREKFELGFITTNYDNIIDQLCPDLFNGFDVDGGGFEAESVLFRKDWGFVYHLHGSINFSMNGSSRNMHEIAWSKKLVTESTAHAFGRSSQFFSERINFPTSPIIAGYGKAQQLLRQPFRTYFAQANRLAHEADSVMFIGYGFGDPHLNAIFSEIRSRPRPVLVLDYAADGTDLFRTRWDTWARNLALTINPCDRKLKERGKAGSSSNVNGLKARKQPECSTDADLPLAIWYNGFMEACRNAEKLILLL